MKKIFRDFKRHYHKTKKLVQEISNLGGFSLNFEFKDDKLTSNFYLPGYDIAVQFAVLMRRFLAPNSDLYYEKIIKLFQEYSLQLLTDEKQKKLMNTLIQ